ncbi:hypothetical protein Cgig2_000819 [Carnegiea gigantea]|uniref:Uncharacterized protein n=1 Tax=Carnegiea gigantea TaxID=171969 RepID=A0A9Q1QLL1_9CARY|nr:hypothetical protein Cgig2_000819 [Carnegiea gigantea]
MQDSMKSVPYVVGNLTNLIAAPNFLPRKKFKLWSTGLRMVLQVLPLRRLLLLLTLSSLPLKIGSLFPQKRESDLLWGLATSQSLASSLGTLPIPTNDPPSPPTQTAPGPSITKVIVLANLASMKSQDEGSPNDDNLVAMVAGDDEGMDEEENVDMFLNLENIEDVEMSTDSSKRKRVEEGEECTSHSQIH